MTIQLINRKTSLVDSFYLHQSSLACPERLKNAGNCKLGICSGAVGGGGSSWPTLPFHPALVLLPSLWLENNQLIWHQSPWGREASFKIPQSKTKAQSSLWQELGPELPPRTSNDAIRYPPNLEGVFAPRNGPSPVPTTVQLFAWAVWGLIYGGVRLTCQSKCILTGVTH